MCVCEDNQTSAAIAYAAAQAERFAAVKTADNTLATTASLVKTDLIIVINDIGCDIDLATAEFYHAAQNAIGQIRDQSLLER